MKIIIVILGIASSIFFNGQWLITPDNTYIMMFADLTKLLSPLSISLLVEKIMFMIWLQLPLIIAFTLACALLLNRLEHQRYFMYAHISTTVFMLLLLPQLPIFNILLPEPKFWSHSLVFIKLFTFIVIFFFASHLLHVATRRSKYTNQIIPLS